MPSCFARSLLADKLLEVAVEFHEQFAGRPDRAGAKVGDARILVVEKPPQLFGHAEHPLGFFVLLRVVAAPRLPRLLFLLGLLH